MIRLAIVALLLAGSISAQPTPEECIAKRDVSVEHGGKAYRLASEACREQFLSDPERYAQLYDALLELQAEGETIAAPRASLVPS